MPPDPEPEAWKQREGEPVVKVITSDGAIVVQSLTVGLTAALVMRPEVAIWLGGQLIQQGQMAKSGLIVPPNGQVPPQLKGVDGDAARP